MRLLPPRERTSLAQQERERLVKEETTLSSRVDALRELEQTELAKLKDFREKEFARFKDEERKRREELATLDATIQVKKLELEAHFGPLDKQWALYKQVEKRKIEEEQARQVVLSSDLQFREQNLDIRAEELDRREVNLKKERSNLLSLSEKIVKDRKEADAEAKNLRYTAQLALETAEVERKQAEDLRIKAQVELSEVDIRKQTLDAREKELEDRETQVLIKELKYYSPVKQHGIPNSTIPS